MVLEVKTCRPSSSSTSLGADMRLTLPGCRSGQGSRPQHRTPVPFGRALPVDRLKPVWEPRSVRQGISQGRFLFVVPPLTGHVNPALGIAGALAARGHDVAWAGSERLLRPMLGPDATVYQTGMRPFRGQGDLGAAAVKSLWEAFAVPLARFTRPAVEKAVRQYRPDVILADQHAFAGPIVAHRNGLPWPTLPPSSLQPPPPPPPLPT